MKNTELKQSQMNVEKTDSKDSSSELISRVDIKDTPFTIITTEEKHFGAMGRYRITELYNTYEEAVEETKKITWNRIVQVIQLVTEMLNDK